MKINHLRTQKITFDCIINSSSFKAKADTIKSLFIFSFITAFLIYSLHIFSWLAIAEAKDLKTLFCVGTN